MFKHKTLFNRKIMLFIFLLTFSKSFAQFRPKTVHMSILNETMDFPSFKLTRLPIHPTINIGSDFRDRESKHLKRTLVADFYYYYQRMSEHAFMLDATYQVGYKFNFGLLVNLNTAIGYKHAILDGKKYKLIDGEYQPAHYLGKAQGNFKLGVGLEYPISGKYSITTDYKAMVVAPFGDRILPISLHTFLGVGLKMKLKN